MRLPRSRSTALLALVSVAGCAGAPPAPPPAVPVSLRPPAGQVLFLEAHATGVQIYECAAKQDQPASFEWAFRAPEATLADKAGKPLGKHYAGPTWELSDGSSVVGAVQARDPGPSPASIPWLLLSAKSTAGQGALTATKSIQRLNTSGGIAPTTPCDASDLKQTVRVPYTAVYDFYR